jgi:cell division control protein 6
MVLDELEHLHGEAIPDIMSVATKAFRIIGISNAHTLTTKPTASTVTFHFKPYAAAEMNEIVSSRLAALPLPSDLKALVVPAALKFACTKIAGQTGDLRSCFALIREAIELAEKEHLKKTLAHQGDDELPIVTIGMGHILGAIKAAASKASGAASVVRQLNLQARLVLLSLLLAIRRLNASLSLTSTPKKGKQAAKPKANETLSIDSLFNFYTTLLKGNDAGFQPVTRSEFTDVLALLETQGLAECGLSAASSKGKKGDKAQTVGMPSNNREEEMVKGLTIPEDGKEEGPKEREIRSIWNKETSRIKREADDQALRFQKRKEAFEEAAEA